MGSHRIDGQPAVGDFLAAFLAITVFAGGDTAFSHLDTHQIALTGPFARLRHRLLLHGVHARKPTDGNLIQLNRSARIARHLGVLFDLGAFRCQPFPCGTHIDCHKDEVIGRPEIEQGSRMR